jgi:hypothetical protein
MRRDSVSIPVPVITPAASASDPRVRRVLELRETYLRTLKAADEDAYKSAHRLLSRQEKSAVEGAVETQDKGRRGSGETDAMSDEISRLR